MIFACRRSFLLRLEDQMGDRRDSKNRKLNKGEYQKADGRYAYRYTDVNGQVRWIYSWRLTESDRMPTGREHGECLRELEAEIMRDIFEGVQTASSKTGTLNERFESYMSIKTELKESTRVRYRYLYSKYISERFGQRNVAQVRYSDILGYFAELIDKGGLKPSSVRCLYNILHPIFAIAVRDGLIRQNPADGVMSELLRTRKGKSVRRKALTQVQQDRFVAFLRDNPKYWRWYRLFIFLLGTGCRIGEARGLTWDDCDFEHGLIYIRRQIVYYRGENDEKYTEHLSTPKSESGERIVPMFEPVRQVLLDEKAVQESMGVVEKTVGGYTGFIFATKGGGCIDSRNVDGAINRIIAAYNGQETERAQCERRSPEFLPHFSVHNLRHTFCTRLCENETNIKVIQEVMGHADISTTMNIYNEAQVETKTRSFEKLEGKIIRA